MTEFFLVFFIAAPRLMFPDPRLVVIRSSRTLSHNNIIRKFIDGLLYYVIDPLESAGWDLYFKVTPKIYPIKYTHSLMYPRAHLPPSE